MISPSHHQQAQDDITNPKTPDNSNVFVLQNPIFMPFMVVAHSLMDNHETYKVETESDGATYRIPF